MESEILALMNAVRTFLLQIFDGENWFTYIRLWLQADIDNNGTIDYGEFLAATLHMNKMEREENLLAAFSFFDKDGSGYITTDELQQACKDFGLADDQIDEIIKEIDIDNVSIYRLVCICSPLIHSPPCLAT